MQHDKQVEQQQEVAGENLSQAQSGTGYNT